MPNFAPNKGFKMPGVGSKNIDSPGNFRDEQHVDKVGYCDTTEDSMLPEGSSPLKARYTTSGYRKDLKEVDLNLRKKKEGCPEGYVKKGEECVKLPENKKQPVDKKPKTDVKFDDTVNQEPITPTDTLKVSDKVTGTPKVPKTKKYIKYSDLEGGSSGAAATAARAENKASGRGDFASTTGKGGRKDDKSRYTVRENETEAQAKKRKMGESR